MSQLLGSASGISLLHTDRSVLKRSGFPQPSGGSRVGPRRNFSSGWWPGSGFIGAASQSVNNYNFLSWADPKTATISTSGTNSRLGFMGVTRDVNNSPLPGATVKLFLTADDSKVTPDVVSDAVSGQYVITTPFYAPHWIKIKKAGSPDVQGVSVDNIYPNV